MGIKVSKWKISEEEFERQHVDALQRGKAEKAKGAYAVTARYEAATKRVIVELANGATLLIPARLIQGLQKGTAKDLGKIEILGAGSGLYWPALGLDIGVTGLLAGIFGTRQWMAELGRSGGKASSEAKRAAARTNGALGGRPRKTESKTATAKKRRAA